MFMPIRTSDFFGLTYPDLHHGLLAQLSEPRHVPGDHMRSYPRNRYGGVRFCLHKPDTTRDAHIYVASVLIWILAAILPLVDCLRVNITS